MGYACCATQRGRCAYVCVNTCFSLEILHRVYLDSSCLRPATLHLHIYTVQTEIHMSPHPRCQGRTYTYENLQLIHKYCTYIISQKASTEGRLRTGHLKHRTWGLLNDQYCYLDKDRELPCVDFSTLGVIECSFSISNFKIGLCTLE